MPNSRSRSRKSKHTRFNCHRQIVCAYFFYFCCWTPGANWQWQVESVSDPLAFSKLFRTNQASSVPYRNNRNRVNNLEREVEEWGEEEGTAGGVIDHSRGKIVCLCPCFLDSRVVIIWDNNLSLYLFLYVRMYVLFDWWLILVFVGKSIIIIPRQNRMGI